MSELKEDAQIVQVHKPNAFHDEDVVEGVDRELSPFQCLRQNPKIVAWSLFANSESYIHSSIFSSKRIETNHRISFSRFLSRRI